MSVLVEVCCGSVDYALEAQAGGADRVELNSSLFFGGLTPSIGALIEAKRLLRIPVMVMIRPRGMSPRNAMRLIQHIGCSQVHVAAFTRRTDPSSRGNPEVYLGSALYAPEDSYELADRSFVAGVREATRGGR